MSETCRECNFYLPKISRCLQYSGFIGINKVKKSLSFGGCESFKRRTNEQEVKGGQ